ncbi:M56 family metallopeptidase [Nocardia seriolae]|uniref:Peptidase M48 domain-containing protein n=1 Tax=Nocardia seriolae TaxID=37332 RepID=A0ABC9YR30_9NOCA|nr:M56 family metallopeptidase [Nocardia seriolae]APB00284.1 hypothetical protein NS506_06248 [Nocardia seriolae]OJF79378.1 hypothetical protein NS14008_09405 [Nocardia seriolae]QOW36715.1 M56 family metallopeptidase [Nocardia seriolae]QUN15769.1 M56 family metallopeptidase [Nocardia seriolae]WKY54603.1 M56 family metallopeptidase [Nocardia seriolae]
MIIACAFLLCAVVLGFAGPPVLHRTHHAFRPGSAITVWLASVAAAVVFGVGGIVLLVLAEPTRPEHLAERAAPSLSAIECGLPAWVSLGAAGIGAGLAAVVAGRWIGAARRARQAHAAALRKHRAFALLTGTEIEATEVIWLEHDRPLAYSLDGRPGLVVASDGLARRLGDEQRRAVIAHEHAHLRRRHHQLLRASRAIAHAAPRVPLFAAAPGAIESLIELDADAHAADATSPATVRSALTAMTGRTNRTSGRLPTDLVDLRLRRLESAVRPARRGLGWIVAPVLPVCVALVITALTLGIVGYTACLAFGEHHQRPGQSAGIEYRHG